MANLAKKDVRQSGDPFGAVEFDATAKAWLSEDGQTLSIDLSAEEWTLFFSVPSKRTPAGETLAGEYLLGGGVSSLLTRIRESERASA
jgi:hypothetical protein